MKKLIVFLMVFSLLFMSVGSNVFAVFTAVNVGPTTDFAGDVNVPSGKGYYINSTLLAFGDVTDALGVTMANVGATAINAALIPDSEDDTDLGSATYEWANLYIGEAGKIYLRKDQSTSLQATGAGILTITAGNGVVLSEGLTVGSAIISDTADTDNLGATDKEWANIYVGTAGKIYLGTSQEVALEVTDENTLAITASSNVDFSGGLDVTSGIIVGSDILSDAADTDSLGSADKEWANLYIGEAGKIYLRNDQSVDLQATGAGILTLTAANGVVTSHLLTATGGLTTGSVIKSDAADTDNLGATDAEWKEIYISSAGHLYLGDNQTTYLENTGANTMTITASGGVTFSAGIVSTNTLGRDSDNDLDWSVDDHCTWTIAGNSVDLVDFATGVGDNDHLATQGYVDDTAGTSINHELHLMDLEAADADYYITTNDTDDGDVIGSIVKQSPYFRNVTVTSSEAVGTLTVTGTTADGTVGATEEIAMSDGTTQGVKGFCNITALVAASADATFTVGLGDIVGLPNAISEELDIYMKTVDGVEEFGEISGNGDFTNNTLDCGTIVANEDITIFYHK